MFKKQVIIELMAKIFLKIQSFLQQTYKLVKLSFIEPVHIVETEIKSQQKINIYCTNFKTFVNCLFTRIMRIKAYCYLLYPYLNVQCNTKVHSYSLLQVLY